MKPTGWSLVFRCFSLLGLCLAISLFQPNILFADTGIPYGVSMEGVTDRDLEKLLKAVSETVSLRKRPPASLSLLQKRAKKDIPRLIKALRSRGFYGARVTFEIDRVAEPIQVIFKIVAGPPYVLKSVDIQLLGEGETGEVKLPQVHEIGLVLGEPGRSQDILDVRKMITRWFRNQGFPFPKVRAPKVIVDHGLHNVSVTYNVQTGPLGRFGSTEIKGLESVNETFVRNKIPWKEGDRFNGDLLGQVKKRLTGTGLYATVQVKAGKSIGRDGRLPIVIEVKERKHRTIKMGASYSTDKGLGGKISWTHRNLFGYGERLNFKGTVSEIAFAAEGGFRKPEFMRNDQALVLSSRLAEDRPIAFTSRNFDSVLQVERTLSKGMVLGVGLGYRLSKVEQLGQEDNFSLLYLPLNFNWDTSDQLLDPSRGGRLNLQLAPYYDTSTTGPDFLKGLGGYRRYWQVPKKPWLVLAFRGTLGAMTGEKRDEIPADLRFYAGGGGSIRGYAYQTVGPNVLGVPIGGRSLFELSAELRIKVTNTIGFVTFLDGGNVFESEFPDFEESLLWGTGLGFRYFTPVGPLRLDVGFPLDRREGIDDSYQIYISLGQAF